MAHLAGRKPEPVGKVNIIPAVKKAKDPAVAFLALEILQVGYAHAEASELLDDCFDDRQSRCLTEIRAQPMKKSVQDGPVFGFRH